MTTYRRIFALMLVACIWASGATAHMPDDCRQDAAKLKMHSSRKASDVEQVVEAIGKAIGLVPDDVRVLIALQEPTPADWEPDLRELVIAMDDLQTFVGSYIAHDALFLADLMAFTECLTKARE